MQFEAVYSLSLLQAGSQKDWFHWVLRNLRSYLWV